MTKPTWTDMVSSLREMMEGGEKTVPAETELDRLAKMYPPRGHNYAHGGEQLRYKFDNGYGASVICHSGSYGGEQGLLELAVLGKKGELCYSTPVTDDVEGWLTAEKAMELLEQIAGLRR